VTLKAPDLTYIYYLIYPVVYEKAQALAAGADFGGPSGLVMGTGPYQIKSFSPASGATMTRFDGYWGAKPAAKELDIKVIADPETLRLAVQSGSVDGTFDVPAGSAKAWESLPNARLQFGSSGTVKMLFLDPTQAPFNDVHARLAIAYAFDRPGIVKALEDGHGDSANTISSPFGWANSGTPAEVKQYFASLPVLNFDMAKAKEELSKSATPNGFTLTVLVPSSLADLSGMMETLKQNVKSIGITINVKQVPLANWLDALRAKNKAPMGIVSISADSPDPLSLVQSLVTGGTDGFSAYAPAAMLSLIAEYKIASPARQLAIAKQVVTQLSTDMPFVPIVYGNSKYALNKKYVYTSDITGWTAFGTEWAHYVEAAS